MVTGSLLLIIAVITSCVGALSYALTHRATIAGRHHRAGGVDDSLEHASVVQDAPSRVSDDRPHLRLSGVAASTTDVVLLAGAVLGAAALVLLLLGR